jgi:hypothetical protein
LSELLLTELPTVRRPTVGAFHAEFVEAPRPVKIVGAIEHWPALVRWSPASFAERHGDFRTFAYAMRDGRITLDRRLGFQVIHLTLREYVARIEEGSSPSLYLRAPLSRLPTALAADLEVPPYCAGRPALRHNLWFGGAGTTSQLHFDLPHNLVAQVHGRKRFVLFEPSERRHLHPASWLSSTPHLAHADPLRPDYERFPRLRSARGWVTTLEPGDLLFIPSRFWHHAFSLTTSISTNFWWSTAALRPLILASDLYKRARGLNI